MPTLNARASTAATSLDGVREDLLIFDAIYGVIICKLCQYAVVPNTVASHLRALHQKDEGLTFAQVRALADHCLAYPARPPAWIQEMPMPLQAPPVHPFLRLQTNGFCCKLCPATNPYICCTEHGIVKHLKDKHQWTRGSGRPSTAAPARSSLGTVATFPVTCQTFFQQHIFLRYFPVQLATRTTSEAQDSFDESREGIQALAIPEQIELQLDQKLAAALNPVATRRPGQQHFSQISAWLETTQWTTYLRGHDLCQAAALIELPPSTAATRKAALDKQESRSIDQLRLLLDSFDRVIEQARSSLLKDRINVFDQHRVNSFLPRRSFKRPLWHKLKEQTYRVYKKIWKQLLCFLYRLVYQKLAPVLYCRLTSTQTATLEAVLRAAANLAAREQESTRATETDPERHQEIDRACLLLCIALLDHPLHGNIHDSVIVGFLAVLGINSQGAYHEATTYTPSLSAFIKLSQLLVVQRAVLAVDEDEVDHPSELLDAMQDRFMVYGSRSPMNWALKLRAYGKKIQDTTTALGHIIWSDDGEELSYRALELTMTSLRRFIADQVESAQGQLQELLLVNPEERREDVVPALALRTLKDDPTASEPGWSFVKDPRNTALHKHDRWLLNRVANTDWLQEEFFAQTKSGKRTAKWSRKATEHYLQQIDAFLHRLLLLVHITGGQPSRGTELLSLQHCNTAHGLRRNIFVENGLVSFVTFYHKGYSIQGSTKIIHRYLPKEVSELLVYYLWLVLPFANQLRLLALDQTAVAVSSPFLWAFSHEAQDEKGQYSPWASTRLSDVLKREFRARLNMHANIQIWRHTIIAISRRHLK